jgi:hypothetical protein
MLIPHPLLDPYDPEFYAKLERKNATSNRFGMLMLDYLASARGEKDYDWSDYLKRVLEADGWMVKCGRDSVLIEQPAALLVHETMNLPPVTRWSQFKYHVKSAWRLMRTK